VEFYKKGNSMEQLSALEKRVLDIVQKNKSLQQENSQLKAEKLELQEQCKRLETSIMDQSQNQKALEVETASVKTTIEGLLDTINSLESSE
jgi:peptidoglycan hydrolase CwlO-like protein